MELRQKDLTQLHSLMEFFQKLLSKASLDDASLLNYPCLNMFDANYFSNCRHIVVPNQHHIYGLVFTIFIVGFHYFC